jgi:hypothetical protein
MSTGGLRVLSDLAAVSVLALTANAQSVISTHSGVIHFFEGTVYLGDQPLESRLGRYPVVPQGGELRTADGRAEVLLTPGVFLRLGQQSEIRMVANDLANTQVELQTGSAIVDSGESNSDTSVTLIYKNWQVHFLEKGVYRIDSDPPRLSVRQGRAEVFDGAGSPPLSVEKGMNLPFAAVLVPEPSSVQQVDALNDWASGRSQSIMADNAITEQIDEDPDSRTTNAGLDAGAFSYFPFLGVPSMNPGMSNLYSSVIPYQPGFSSIYLPGYTYRPLILGLVGNGYRSYSVTAPRRIFVTPGTPGIGSYVPSRAPLPRPAPIRVAPRVTGVHVGAHR